MSAPIQRPQQSSPGPVLFVSHSAVWGGAERIITDVADQLGSPAALLCPEGELAVRARAAGVPVLAQTARPPELRGGPAVRARAVAGLTAHAREIRRCVKSLNPRLVLGFGMRSAIAGAAALRSVPASPPIVFAHVDFLPSPGVSRAVRAAAGRAARVIALSEAVAADLDPLGRLGPRLQVVEPGVDVENFGDMTPPADPPVALQLGAIASWKRPDLALEAVSLAARRLPDLRLVIAGHTVGEASERLLEELRSRAARPDLAGRVELAGRLVNPRDALEQSSCLLHCADREPFGLVLLEAMAAGRPVVAPAAGGPLEIVADGCGRLFSPGDAQAAASALVELLSDQDTLRRSGERGRRRVAERFTADAARRRWLEAMSPMLPGPSSAPAGDGLTLVTVSHNSASELDRLLGSVARHLPSAETIVVDSGSEDASPAVARRWGRRVRVLELDNVGYGRATNAGVAEARTAACIVLNPDTELVDESLAAIASEAVRPEAAARLLAPVVLRPDGRRQDSVHPEPVSGAAVIAALVPPAALPSPLRRHVQPWTGDEPRRVAWAVGCCFAAATHTLRRLGPFDERIFLYAEDLELGLRARKAGVETWWWPNARLIHHGAHAVQRAFGGEPYDLLASQRHAVVAELRGKGVATWDHRLQAATYANRIALKTLLRRSTERERCQLRAVRRSAGSRLANREVAPRTHA